MRKPTQTILIINLSGGDGFDYEELLQQDSKVLYRCFIASSETQTLALSQSHHFDAILLDSQDCDRSASVVIESLKTQMEENCPPIIVIDCNDARLATRAIKAGAVDYLVREELSSDILVQSLQEVISSKQNHLIEQRQAQVVLRKSEAQLQSIANLVPDLLWDSEPGGSTNWYNHRWMEYTGQTFEQAIGWGWIDAIHPDDRATSARRYHEAVQQGVQLQQEHRIRR
jgi:PAS domain-containing protein